MKGTIIRLQRVNLLHLKGVIKVNNYEIRFNKYNELNVNYMLYNHTTQNRFYGKNKIIIMCV